MKKNIILFIAISLMLTGCASQQIAQFETINVKAPFPMDTIKIMMYPNNDFYITDYGAVEDDAVLNTKAIASAIEACNGAGGGRVMIQAGNWLTGPIHFKSNINLYLSEDAVLNFTDNPEDYLPAVKTSWEGLECYNYSPLLYAYECENVAITGPGTLNPKMDLWREWFKRPELHMNGLAELYLGDEASKPYYRWVEPGVDPKKPDGLQDDTHMMEKGAKKVAQFVAESIAELNLSGLSENITLIK